MRDADETIERLLAGLRDAKPSAGLERRILEALDGMEARHAVASRSLWRRPILPWQLRPPIAMPLACAVALASWLIVAITVHQQRHAPADVRSHSTSADVRQASRPEAVEQKAPVVPRRPASRVAVRRPDDVPAVGETQAASFPAPPLPLTEQERLLLRLAHRGDAENMAILNPDMRAAQTAKATEQFQQFFEINAAEMRSQSE
jgi:hypothetical protein